MTIEWKIGKEYRTRAGEKVYLFGITRSGTNHFEDKYGSRFTTDKQGYWLNSNCKHDNDIAAEWREPHVHECEIWVREGAIACGVPSEIFNLPVITWSTTQLSESRKFKVRVEEVLE